MESLFVIVAVGLLVWLLARLIDNEKGKRRRVSNAAWRKVAEDFGLELCLGDERTLAGTVDGVSIGIREHYVSDSEGSSWATIARAGGSFSIAARRITFRRGSIRTGDSRRGRIARADGRPARRACLLTGRGALRVTARCALG